MKPGLFPRSKGTLFLAVCLSLSCAAPRAEAKKRKLTPKVTCAQVRCMAGTRCDDKKGNASCVPDPGQSPPKDNPAQLPAQDVKAPPKVLPKVPRCASVRCVAGTHCVDDEVGVRCAPDAKAGDSAPRPQSPQIPAK